MSSQVVRVQGFTKGSLSGIGKEVERGDVEHRNADIRAEDKYLNMTFKQTNHGFYGEWNDIKTALNAGGKETKNGIAFEGMVITADKSFFEGYGWEQGKPMPPEVVKFFDDSYKWAKSEIGYQGTDKNIMSAVVHADENTPHLQLYYLPITDKWQEKVYAKSEDGKVLRTEKGTPIQAKNENGKTIYKQVEDSTAPKLARSEFWRVRGGQTSYSQMQDRFHEQIGERYGLERGEVGSDKQHRTKNQWEQEQLTAEKEKLTAEVTPYRELKTGIEQVETPGKTILPGVVAVKKKDLDSLREQAKAYTVNRGEIDNIRQRISAVSLREHEADRREGAISDKEKAVQSRELTAKSMITKQKDLNNINSDLEFQIHSMKLTVRNQEHDIGGLKAENASLQAELSTVKENLTQKIEKLTETTRGAYTSLTNVVKAVGMLKWDKTDGYAVPNLTQKQSDLIESVGKYSEYWAEKDGHKDLAEDMGKHISISKGIKKEMQELQQERTISHDFGPSL